MGADDLESMNSPKTQTFAALPTRESVTNFQVCTLLDILGGLQPFVLLQPRDMGDRAPELDGGVASSAAATFINATTVLDAILTDPERWTLGEVKSLHAALIKTQEAQQTFLAEQLRASAQVLRPSFVHQPTLFASGGRFIAVLGRVNIPGAYLVGEGATPAEALLDFDAAFGRTTEEQRQIIFETEAELDPEPIPSTPITFRPKKRKK